MTDIRLQAIGMAGAFQRPHYVVADAAWFQTIFKDTAILHLDKPGQYHTVVIQ